MIRRPPRSTLFPTRRSSDLERLDEGRFHRIERVHGAGVAESRREHDRALRAAAVSREAQLNAVRGDRKSTRLNSSHPSISYAVFCLKKKKKNKTDYQRRQRQ